MQFLFIESNGKPLCLVSQKAVGLSVVKEYNSNAIIKAGMKLSMTISEGKKLMFKFLRELHLNWYLSVVKMFAARNKFSHAKVARNTKKAGQACSRPI